MMRDRIVIGTIAFCQFWISLFSLGLGMTYLGGPLFLLFGLWGLINSVALVPSSIRARKSALAWYIVLVVYSLLSIATNLSPQNQSAAWIGFLCMGGAVAAIFYLGEEPEYLKSRSK